MARHVGASGLVGIGAGGCIGLLAGLIDVTINPVTAMSLLGPFTGALAYVSARTVRSSVEYWDETNGDEFPERVKD
jgi:hypothetical protein